MKQLSNQLRAIANFWRYQVVVAFLITVIDLLIGLYFLALIAFVCFLVGLGLGTWAYTKAMYYRRRGR